MSFSLFSQNRQEYYVELNSGIDLGTINRTVNTDETLTITTGISDFSNFINSKSAYTFRKAFPTAVTPRLQGVYLISLDESQDISDFINRDEVANIFLLEIPQLLGIYPNDYTEIVFDNLENTVLELIKAPLAWTITQGDPSIFVGVADTKADLNHEDLQGQIEHEILLSGSTVSHGTGVASLVAAKNNNSKGIASIAGYNTKLVLASCNGFSYNSLWEGMLQASQYPGVKVVNCSWVSSTYNPIHELLVNEITLSGVLIVAAAGNGGTGYKYPASYDNTLSVTGVGQRYPIGYHNPFFWGRSWKDCHEFRPDISNENSSQTHNDKVDVSAPGHRVLSATDKYDEYPSGYKTSTGTSLSTPIVTGLAALVFSANPNLTPIEVKDIIKNTADDIYHIPYNQDYIGLLGTGRVNAYRAVLTASCMLNPTIDLDLAMQNSKLDNFEEPDSNTEYPWRSEDIWVRNQNDGILACGEHQNPEYDSNNPNYAYVSVTNNSCVTSSGNDQLKLYWAKASTALSWPLHWEGNLSIEDPQNPGTLSIPPLEIGESKILEFEWSVPNPDDYININPDPWHFCLLARIESNDDPMTFTEGTHITTNVLNNNSIAWKNMTVVDIIPDSPSPITAVVAVGNPTNQAKSYNLELVKEIDEAGKALYDEAEVSVTMDAVIYNAWNNGGKISTNFQASFGQTNKIIVENDHALIENIQLGPNEIGTVSVSFNFLTDELTDKTKFVYHLIQRDAVTNQLIGGETFEVRKQARSTFDADAGSDEEIDINETITIAAEEINEAATYNWYDPDGNLIHSGTDLTVTPNITQTYKLEIVSNIDGFKDYDEVQVTVNPYKIESLVPNPTSSQVTVNYLANGATSAYVMVVNTNTGNSDNYILDVLTSTTTIDVSSFSTGLYNVILVCDGVIQNSKNLIKQ